MYEKFDRFRQSYIIYLFFSIKFVHHFSEHSLIVLVQFDFFKVGTAKISPVQNSSDAFEIVTIENITFGIQFFEKIH
jgi:hypothetical protein